MRYLGRDLVGGCPGSLWGDVGAAAGPALPLGRHTALVAEEAESLAVDNAVCVAPAAHKFEVHCGPLLRRLPGLMMPQAGLGGWDIRHRAGTHPPHIALQCRLRYGGFTGRENP